jgi:hypothetical protein
MITPATARGSAITATGTTIANTTDAAVVCEMTALLSPAEARALDDVSGKDETEALEGVTEPEPEAGAETAAAAPWPWACDDMFKALGAVVDDPDPDPDPDTTWLNVGNVTPLSAYGWEMLKAVAMGTTCLKADLMAGAYFMNSPMV